MEAIIPEWIAPTQWSRPMLPAVRPHTYGNLQAEGLNTTEEGNSLTSLAVHPIVAASADASVAVHIVLTRRSVLTRGILTIVDV